jgi:hypothetical protein
VFYSSQEIQQYNLLVQNGTDMMEYVDNYITPELVQIVVNQTNLYAQQQIATMP